MGIIYLDSFEGYADTVGTGERSIAFGPGTGSVSYISRTGARSLGPIVGNLSSSNPDSLFYYNANPKMRIPPFLITTSLGIAGAVFVNDKHSNTAHAPLLTINVDGINGGDIQPFRASAFIDGNYHLWAGVSGRTNFAGGGWTTVVPTYHYIPSLKWSHLAIYVSSAVHQIGHSTQREVDSENHIVFVDYSGIWDISLEVSIWLNGVQIIEQNFLIGYHSTRGVKRDQEDSLTTFVSSEDIGSYYSNQFNQGFVVDDLYLFTNPGDVIDLPIDIIRPNGFSVSNWIPSDPTRANWELVRDATADDDLSVVTSTYPGQLDMYQFEDTNLGSDSAIIAVQLTHVVKKNANSVATTSVVWDPGGTGHRFVDVPNVLHDGSHVYFQQVQMFNPVTSNYWTVAELDNILAGVLRVS